MKRLIIIVEGHTEEEFVHLILTPYLKKFGVQLIDCFKIKHSNGGLNKYEHLKKDILNCVNDSNCLVTTLVDYYALPKDFPQFKFAHETYSDKRIILSHIEQSIITDIEISLSRQIDNLLPYIQLHEFEALVFACSDGISKFFIPRHVNTQELKRIKRDYPNPENINNGPNTAPSKRLIRIITGYDKVIDGVNIINEIGIETLIETCPRFKIWIENIIAKFTNL